MNKQLGYTIIEVIIVVLFLAATGGWVWNIVKIVGVINDPLTLMVVLRIVGVLVAPLGAVLGYL